MKNKKDKKPVSKGQKKLSKIFAWTIIFVLILGSILSVLSWVNIF